jgi:hypothetical protein
MWNTPYPQKRRVELDALFGEGRDTAAWHHRKMIAVVERRNTPEATNKLLLLGYHRVYQNSDYEVFLRLPLSPSLPALYPNISP